MKRRLVSIGTALLAAFVFTGIIFTNQSNYKKQIEGQGKGLLKSIDNRFFDFLLHLKKPIAEENRILLLEIDDQTITEVNSYPLPREVFADGMILASEFAPAWVMLDIEFVDSSEDGINNDWKDYGLINSIENNVSNLTDNQEQLVNLILNRQITRNQALEYLEELKQAGWDTVDRIIEDIDKLTFSKDEYLAQALAYLGNVTATVNMVNDRDETISEELRQWTETNVSINDYLTFKDDLTFQDNQFDSAVEIQPAIMPIIQSSRWAGFPRSYIDADGTRRRVDLIYRQGDKYYTNLGFGTWWVRAGKPPITVYSKRIEAGNLSIPLDQRGKMLLNWPKRNYDGTPLNRRQAKDFDSSNPDHRLSFLYLYYHDLLLGDLSNFINELEGTGITSDVYGDTAAPLSSMITDLETMQREMLGRGDGARAPELGQYRDEFIETAMRFYNGNAEEIANNELDSIINNPETPGENLSSFVELRNTVGYLFSETRTILDEVQIYRKHLRNRLEDAVVITGYTGTSTTDYGANPFEKRYMNMGIYGVLYNSLLEGQFLKEIPLWICFIVILIAGLGAVPITNISKKNSGLNTILGALYILIIVGAGGLFFALTGVYFYLLPLILTLLTVYLQTLVGNFLATSKEKAFIQNAFGQIISPDVVKEIQDNPDMLNMSGDNRSITAMFSDIEKFSTISEHLGSSDKLFEFIKQYLTPMSDVILEELGTIDKYEGDAIIAFWNAPISQDDHPVRACRAAMRMVQLEREINKDLIESGLLDDEILSRLPHGQIFTRMGINTGINNVGFIGTNKRKDYTALGDEMNLAARLEGVNKQYNTQVLISSSTEEAIRGDFITRHLDRIRVMGKEKPVTCYELCYHKDYMGGYTVTQKKCFELYHQGLELFYDCQWDEAQALFRKILRQLPNDGPSKVFISRCIQYRDNPPPGNWDGVYRMETK